MAEIISPPRERLPEVKPETLPEAPEKITNDALAERSPEPAVQAPGPAAAAPQPPAVLAEPAVQQKKVEQVLAQGLEQLYSELRPEDKVKFKTLGENTAKKITDLLQRTKVKISEILALIRQWLMSLSGVNRYFVEQEAKIKAEKLIKLRQEK
ncbi:MAG TPA: hypothetical protein VJA28_03070 [Patescibacteria group bacterium]|nr:hypothetical protein [Patescibacteria group bacterium]